MRTTDNEVEFARSVVACAANPTRLLGDYSIQVLGYTDLEHREGMAENHYFTAVLQAGKRDDLSVVNNLIVPYSHNNRDLGPHNPQEEVSLRLESIVVSVEKALKDKGICRPSSTKNQKLKMLLDKRNGILTVHPFQ